MCFAINLFALNNVKSLYEKNWITYEFFSHFYVFHIHTMFAINVKNVITYEHFFHIIMFFTYGLWFFANNVKKCDHTVNFFPIMFFIFYWCSLKILYPCEKM